MATLQAEYLVGSKFSAAPLETAYSDAPRWLPEKITAVMVAVYVLLAPLGDRVGWAFGHTSVAAPIQPPHLAAERSWRTANGHHCDGDILGQPGRSIAVRGLRWRREC